MLSNMKLPIEVFTKWAEEGRDEAMAKGHANSVNAMLDFTFKNIDNRFTFIDSGCGNGWVVRIVGDHPLCNKAIGVDGSKSMIEKAISIDKKNIYEYLLKQDLNNSFIIIGTGSPFQENLATFIYENFKNVEVYTCGGFITQTAESISNKSNHNYYPEFISKFNLRWLYRVLTTNYVLKRVLFYYPISVIYLIYELIIKRNDNK